MLASVVTGGTPTRDEPAPQFIRGVLVDPSITSKRLDTLIETLGANAVVLRLSDSTDVEPWADAATAARESGRAVYAWIDVARAPRLAFEHREWLASPGTHHDDWRRLFPDFPRAVPNDQARVWPWIPIGYRDAYAAQRSRVDRLLATVEGRFDGVFLNGLQGGPSACGCGNGQCRWALDYGLGRDLEKLGPAAAARFVKETAARHPGRTVIPVWVTECEDVDLPDRNGGTGHCGGVPCAKGACWPRYAETWNLLVEGIDGPIAVGLWSSEFRRDPETWPARALDLFRDPPGEGKPIPSQRAVAVVEGFGIDDAARRARIDRITQADHWVLAVERVDESWQPRGAGR